MRPNHDNDKGSIQDSVARLFDGDLSEEEFAALTHRLREDPEARELYFRSAALETALDHVFAPPLSRSKTSHSAQAAVIRKQAKWALGIAAAAAVVIASVMWVIQIRQSPPATIALRLCSNSQWTVDGVIGPRVSSLPLGARIVIAQGVAELKLPNEVLAVVEAPAAIVVVDARTLQLDHGRAFFRVSSEEGKGFTVVTPQQRIVDLGTAFGIDARNNRDGVELHVFEGRVRVDDLGGGTGETIKADRSVLLDGARVQRELDGPRSAFLRELPPRIETLLQEDFESGLVGGRNYAVQIDPTAIRDLAGNRFRGIDDSTTWNFTTALPATVPTPVASYAYDGANPPTDQPSDHQPSASPPGLFSDPGNMKLTDGNPGDSAGWPSGTYVGFEDRADVSNPQVTFDLGTVHDVQTITVMLHTMTSDTPESVNISVSIDGIEYSTPFGLVPQCSGSGLVTAALDVSTWAPARYYRMNFVNPTQWTFLGEVGFSSAATPSRGNDQRVLTGANPVSAPNPGMSDRDDSPPMILALHPANEGNNTTPDGLLTMIFDEPIKLGTGRIFLRNITDLSEREIAVGGPRTSVQGRVVTIIPPADLPDGARSLGRISGWEGDTWIGLFNPNGDGTRYAHEGLTDKGQTRGSMEFMRGPTMASFGAGPPGTGIRREFAMIAPNSRYTVSTSIGLRAKGAKEQSAFLGYTIRLLSGGTILAELSSNTPPGPPNSVSPVGFSWDSSDLPKGVNASDPLAIEIAPNQASGLEPGYLDLDNVRVTVVGK